MIIEPNVAPTEFSVGVCATGDSENLDGLIDTVMDDARHNLVVLRKFIIVASACSGLTLAKLQSLAATDDRLLVLAEETRRGKADAINKIMERSTGEFIVLLNSDARPERGAIARLLRLAAADTRIGIISAMPVPDAKWGATSWLARFMWDAHNVSSLALNHMNLANHASDELVTFRTTAVSPLPPGLVNDGAFLAATARLNGYAVKFSAHARVHVGTPRRLCDIIGQRRRILFGHSQVWRETGSPPKTIESLLVSSPALSLRFLVRTVSKQPRYLLALPVAFVVEFSATLLSIWDNIRSTKRHAVWRRYT